jgi:release factor glutamine methyltransferase
LPAPSDLIVANPPYVAAKEFASLQTSVRVHEPTLALNGGDDGLTLIRRLLTQAPAALNPGGTLLVEIGARQGALVTALARTAFPHAAVRIHPDLAGRDRVLEVET